MCLGVYVFLFTDECREKAGAKSSIAVATGEFYASPLKSLIHWSCSLNSLQMEVDFSFHTLVNVLGQSMCIISIPRIGL